MREQPRRTSPWGWVVAGLMIFAMLAAIVYGVNLQQQRAAQATATAQAAQATATAQAAQATATARAQATATARAAQATATSAAIQAVRVFGPENGTASIYNLDSRVMVSSGVKLRNFIAEITVYNPPTASWGYAFDFRETYTDHAGFLAVFSNRSWGLTIDDAGRYTTISRGYIENLNVSQNGYNRIRLIALDDTGFFYVNNIFISVLDLSGNLNIGDVILEIYPTATGQIRYTDFTVWRLP